MMKKYILVLVAVSLCAACEQRIEAPAGQPAEKTVEKNTTIVNPPTEKTVEKNTTTIVEPNH